MPRPKMPITWSAARSGTSSRWRGSKQEKKTMIPNKDKTKETKKTRQAKNGERQETALLSDIVTLPDPRFKGRIGSTQAPGATVVSGPVRGTRITEPYARLVARDTYFWAWTLSNVYNRRRGFESLKEPGKLGGVLPAAPPNRITMLTDYILPSQREVCCPNQDVAYGAGPLALDLSPVVVQVPDFGDRFWVYQIVDLRTDSFADLGKMYGSKPGFYLLSGPRFKGDMPKGINEVFTSKTNTGFICPRVYMDDTAEDRKAIQPVISQMDVYPLSAFDGKVKKRDWASVPSYPAPPPTPDGGEAPKVHPDTFFDDLRMLLEDAPPLPGEEVRYAEALSLVAAAQADPKIKAAIIDEAKTAQEELIEPLLQFRNYGLSLPH